MPPDWLALVIASAFYFGGAWFTVWSLSRGGHRGSLPGLLLVLAGFASQCVFLALRGKALGRCPITTPFELLTFVSWAMVLLYFIVGRAYRLSLLGAFTAPLAFVLQTTALLKPGSMAPARAGVSSGFWPEMHATLSLVAYGAFALACVAGILFLIQDRQLKQHRGIHLVRNLPPIHLLHQAIGRLILTGTAILTTGIIAAYQMPSRPPVGKLACVWSIWVLYAALLIYERWRGMSARRAAWAAALGFLFPVVSLWIVVRR